MNTAYTIGQRITVRGEDFLITDINDGGNHNLLLDVVGISPLVMDKTFCFDTALEDDIEPVRPENTRRTRQTLWSAVQMLTQKLCCQTIHDCPKVVPLHYESE